MAESQVSLSSKTPRGHHHRAQARDASQHLHESADAEISRLGENIVSIEIASSIPSSTRMLGCVAARSADPSEGG